MLLEMINDILDLAKIESGQDGDAADRSSASTRWSQAQCDMARPLTEEKNIDLESTSSRNLPPCTRTRPRCSRFSTICSPTPSSSRPKGAGSTCSPATTRDGRLLLTVADTGVGIAEEDRDIIFEKFRQSGTIVGDDGMTREYSGTGLGLSIVKELCKLLGGEVSFESELGGQHVHGAFCPGWRPIARRAKAGSNVQLHDLGAPSADEFKGPRGRPATRPRRGEGGFLGRFLLRSARCAQDRTCP